jgi:hypothetical protein
MFHWQDNFYFGRCLDGTVRIVKFDSPRAPHAMWKHGEDAVTRETDYPDAEGEFNDVKVVLDVRVPAEHWASIIASVSAKGEEGGRYYEALKWHNDK